jgi:methionyl aminopeptidase
MIVLKSDQEIEAIHAACRIVSEVLELVGAHIRPGIRTVDLDRMAEEHIVAQGARPAFKGFRGYPKSICVSIDREVVHGIPGQRRLCEGELASIDVGVEKAGYYGDGAMTFCVGHVPQEKVHLARATCEALSRGIAKATVGNRLSDISWAIQEYIEDHGYSVVRALVGHGIGTQMHEAPQIPNFGRPGTGPVLKPGMALAIEPMVNAGGYEVETLDDDWTVVTRDGLPSAHFEHTVAVTENGPRVLTKFTTNGLCW